MAKSSRSLSFSADCLAEHAKDAEPFEVTPEQEAELLEAIRGVDPGDVIKAEEPLARLSR